MKKLKKKKIFKLCKFCAICSNCLKFVNKYTKIDFVHWIMAVWMRYAHRRRSTSKGSQDYTKVNENPYFSFEEFFFSLPPRILIQDQESFPVKLMFDVKWIILRYFSHRCVYTERFFVCLKNILRFVSGLNSRYKSTCNPIGIQIRINTFVSYQSFPLWNISTHRLFMAMERP